MTSVGLMLFFFFRNYPFFRFSAGVKLRALFPGEELNVSFDHVPSE